MIIPQKIIDRKIISSLETGPEGRLSHQSIRPKQPSQPALVVAESPRRVWRFGIMPSGVM
jgi:hypothetical protein